MAKLNADSVVKTVNTTDVDAAKKTTTVTRKKYEPDDLVSVRSTTQGTLLLPGSKSKILYTWESYGDVVQVEYQDLYTLKASRSNYLYKPFFVIEDEELLEDPRWSDLKKVYDNMFTKSDISTILKGLLVLNNSFNCFNPCFSGFLSIFISLTPNTVIQVHIAAVME